MSDAAVRPVGPVLHQLRLFFVAMQFLTRVPVPAWATLGFQPVWLNTCVAYFPLVGAMVGAVGALVLVGASAVWSPWVAAALSVTAMVVLTGAFHEDGLADTFDALGGSVPRDRALTIMKDSRIGTYGAAALGLALVLRVVLLATLVLSVGVVQAGCFLVVAHALGRAAAVMLMHALAYAGDAEHAKAKPLATAVPAAAVGSALVFAALIWVAVAVGSAPIIGGEGEWSSWPFWVGWVRAPLAALAVVLWMRWWLKRRLGGYTGDTLGAAVQLCELAVLLALSARLGP
jgi:adenosylcobinamide-GDP ribazoletransferase